MLCCLVLYGTEEGPGHQKGYVVLPINGAIVKGVLLWGILFSLNDGVCKLNVAKHHQICGLSEPSKSLNLMIKYFVYLTSLISNVYYIVIDLLWMYAL